MFLNSELKNKRKQILDIAYTHGAKTIKIFGSFVRGEEKEDSDIDLLVSFKEGRSLFDLIALKNDLEELFGRKVDVVTEDSIHSYIRDKIMQEAVEI